MQMVGGAGDRAAIRARREHLLGGVSEMSFPFSEGARPMQGDEERDGGAGFGRGWRGWGRGVRTITPSAGVSGIQKCPDGVLWQQKEDLLRRAGVLGRPELYLLPLPRPSSSSSLPLLPFVFLFFLSHFSSSYSFWFPHSSPSSFLPHSPSSSFFPLLLLPPPPLTYLSLQPLSPSPQSPDMGVLR